MPSNAVFNSNLTYTPGGGGKLTQPFAVTVSYAAINAGTIDVPVSNNPATFVVPFGSVANANGLVLRNNTLDPLGIRLNGAGTDNFQLAPNGVLMHFAPKPGAALTTPLASAIVSIGATTAAGSVDFIVLGD